jgi:hypothetical protein
MDVSGRWLDYSTYLGGSGDEVVRALALDQEGNAVLLVATSSTDFPLEAADALGLQGPGFVLAGVDPAGSLRSLGLVRSGFAPPETSYLETLSFECRPGRLTLHVGYFWASNEDVCGSFCLMATDQSGRHLVEPILVPGPSQAYSWPDAAVSGGAHAFVVTRDWRPDVPRTVHRFRLLQPDVRDRHSAPDRDQR